jgi:uncharacterized membrane protein YpjA
MYYLQLLTRWLQELAAKPNWLTLILIIDIFAYFAGLVYWYGAVMANPATPMWAWPFIPDCPLFGLLGGLGLCMAATQTQWRESTRRRAQQILCAVGGVSALLCGSMLLPGAPLLWRALAGTMGMWALSFLVVGLYFRRPPTWLLGIFALGQIKYGIWTVTAWLLFWQNTARVYGAPLFTFDSVLMTVSHLAMIGQGLLLLTYFLPNWRTALASLLWFGASDYADYGLGFHPYVVQLFTPIVVLQWSTIAVTLLGALWYVGAAWPLSLLASPHLSVHREVIDVSKVVPNR